MNYDPGEFEMARRVIAASPTSYNSVAKLFTAAQIPSAPTKWDWNNRGALSTDVIDPRIGFTMDYATRDSYEAFIKRRTKNWLYFLRTDAAVPAELKAELAGYGPCRDEFVDDKFAEGFPGECYWRDGFRMTKRNAKEVLREQHVLKTEVATNPICFATYPSDGHYRSYRNIGGVLQVCIFF